MSGDDLGRAITTEVQRANERALGDAVAIEFQESDVTHRVTGFGILQPLLDDPTVEEIWVNDSSAVFVARSGRHERIPADLSTDDLRTLVERMLRRSGRRKIFRTRAVMPAEPAQQIRAHRR